jgi:type IV/VI secretion system ImpK/VasF family protein
MVTPDFRYEKDYRTELFRLASPLFLYLVSFRRKIRKQYPVDIDEVRQNLDLIFTQMEFDSRRDQRLDALYLKAKYPLVILADEVLITSGWDQADAWQQDHLEKKHFKTNIGGDKVFQIENELMSTEVELAVILYTAICLGVKGRYHDDPAGLQEVKSRLYRMLGDYLGDVQSNIITPEAYHVTPKQARRLTVGVAMTHVAVACGVLFISYILANWAIWRMVVSKLDMLTRPWL